VTLPPFGPVHVAEELQLPPEQLELPLRVTVLPRTPVNSCDELQEPFAHEPWPLECQERPSGPVPPPERTQPASAVVAVPSASAATQRSGNAELLIIMVSPHR
jgi:hypothetical protein